MTADPIPNAELLAGDSANDPGLRVERDRDGSGDAELLAERDRLTERFVLMQSELGGLFYEMAVRDSLQLELLVERAAALQRVELDLRELERHIAAGRREVQEQS